MKRWRKFFGSGDLMPLAEVERQYPNARRHARGCLFVSHSGPDTSAFSEAITRPLRKKYSHYAVFQYSSKDVAREAYKQIVLLALTYCKCALVACSRQSSNHEWVFAEVDWLLHHKRPIFVLRLDDTSPERVHPGLGSFNRLVRGIESFTPSQAPSLLRKIERHDLPQFPEADWGG